MNSYSLTHLQDHVLSRDLDAVHARTQEDIADLLAHLAEFDARKLYAPAAYPSMFAYCVDRMRMSEDTALKRIQAARAARKFPAIFAAIAAGRLHLSGVVLLAPYLSDKNAGELLTAATHRTHAEVRQLLAERFPRPDVPGQCVAVGAPSEAGEHAAQHVGMTMSGLLAAQDAASQPTARVTPLAPERFALQVTIGRSAHDKLKYAQSLRGKAPGELADLFEEALDAYIAQLEQKRFAATTRPGKRRSSGDGRSLPAEVKRAVWQRDGGQCTFVSDDGHRCECRDDLHFDHIEPVARGGRSTVDNVRLRCPVHNQLEADRTFGAGFMEEKRAGARQRRAEAKARRAAEAATAPPEHDEALAERTRDVEKALRSLKFTAAEAKAAALPDAARRELSLADHVRCALKRTAIARPVAPAPMCSP